MMTPARLLGLFVHALGLAWLATGCVRLTEPDHFVCDSAEDCESNEKCLSRSCVPKDSCSYSGDCFRNEHCEAAHCVPNLCEPETEATSCSGFVCIDGQCRTDCFYTFDCAQGFHCDSFRCVAGAPRTDGQACTKDAECAAGKCCAKPTGSVCTEQCSPVPDDRCTTSTDCLSGYCCAMPGGKTECSSVPCAQVPECEMDIECGIAFVCTNGKCVEPPPLANIGEPCEMDSDCRGDVCFENVCRGNLGEGDECAGPAECAPNRLCCESRYSADEWTCGELNRGCPGTIGDSCQLGTSCLEGACVSSDGGFCTKPCTSNADCGVSPWGVPNACETNGQGNRICFPGCTTNKECYDNLGSDLDCYQALESGGKICAAG